MKKNKTDPYWQNWVDCWFDFVQQKTGFPPVFLVRDAVALKNIRKYFLSLTNTSTGEKNAEEQSLFCMQYILKNWDKIDKFRQQYSLTFIYAHLNDYISDLKKSLQSRSEIKTRNIQEKGYDYYKNL